MNEVHFCNIPDDFLVQIYKISARIKTVHPKQTNDRIRKPSA